MNSSLKELKSDDKLLHVAMFMEPANMPAFPSSMEVAKLADTITHLFNVKKLTHMSLKMDGSILCF